MAIVLSLIFTLLCSARAENSQWRLFWVSPYVHYHSPYPAPTNSVFVLDEISVREFKDIEEWAKNRPSQVQFCRALGLLQRTVDEELITADSSSGRRYVVRMQFMLRLEDGALKTCEVSPDHQTSLGGGEILCSELCIAPNS
jgi:hypothetical protein